MEKATYNGNDNETYILTFKETKIELQLPEYGALEITSDINDFIECYSNETDDFIIEVKSDEEQLGIIVDIWYSDESDIHDTSCFWFDDYIY